MDTHSISHPLFERVMAFLANLFLPACGGDIARARDAVYEALAEYEPRTNRQLRLAALSLAFSLGALDALGRAMDDSLSINQVLRLRSSANTLQRSAFHAEKALAEDREEPETEAEDAPLPEGTEPAELANFVRTSPKLSREQRRKQEREAARRRRHQETQARLSAREAQQVAHAAMQAGAASLTSHLPPEPIFPVGTAGAGDYATSAVA